MRGCCGFGLCVLVVSGLFGVICGSVDAFVGLNIICNEVESGDGMVWCEWG